VLSSAKNIRFPTKQYYLFKNEFQPCLVGEADLKEQINPYLEKWGWKKSVDDFLEH